MSFALTVGKAQGHRYNVIVVDWFAEGHMIVAIGKTKSIEGLRIVNYNSDAARIKNPSHVDDYYQIQATPPEENMLCCRNSVQDD